MRRNRAPRRWIRRMKVVKAEALKRANVVAPGEWTSFQQPTECLRIDVFYLLSLRRNLSHWEENIT